MKYDITKVKTEIENLKEYVSNDFDLKIVEFYFKEILPQKSNRIISSPLLPIILSAFFAIIGTAFGAWLQGQSNLELERQKYESNLVLKMVETSSKKEAISNLVFALNIGLIKNETLFNNIQKAIRDSTVVNIVSAYNAQTDSVFLKKVEAIKNISGGHNSADSVALDAIKRVLDQNNEKIKQAKKLKLTDY